MKLIRDKNELNSIDIDYSVPIMCDTETYVDPGKTTGALYGQIRLFQIFQKGWEEAIIVDIMWVDLEDVLDILEGGTLVFHNAAYDMHTIRLQLGRVWWPAGLHDTRLLAKLHWYDLEGFSLFALLEYIGLTHDLKKSEFGGKSDWGGPLKEEQLRYAALDVELLQELFDHVIPAATNYQYAYDLDIESLRLAMDYSDNGIKLNRPKMAARKLEALKELEIIVDRIKINPRSSTQVPDYIMSNKSDGPTLDLLIMEGTDEQKRRANDVKTARHLYKELSYIDSYTGDRLYGIFNPTNSKSGRWSCSGGDRIGHVNLQQVPSYLKPIVLGFDEESDKCLVYYDYSGLELRLAVAYTGDKEMVRMMMDDADMHTETAKYIYQKEDISPWERTMSKAFTFSLIYGASARTVHGTLKRWGGMDITVKEVGEMRKLWFEKYSGFTDWHNRVKKEIKQNGFIDVHTACHRYSRYTKMSEALNMPIQGTGSEATKHGLKWMYEKYPDVKFVNTIHDSVILECPESEAEMWKERLGSEMSRAFSYVIQNWAEPQIPMPHDDAESGKMWTF